ncbi:hypothetical protein WR25_13018 [Diploscapter pachys]|uniref:Uncharacterized protein n=1 Tax=Diploscapter pachys TaxID=2018661 RepID=A0A2A2M391_9BILA|nr:hypothetical protein WR25_13018 [Diploscapter pachys]
MLLDADDLLLPDEPMPAAERLGVGRRVGIVRRHVPPHDRRGIARDIEARLEAVLQPHTRDRFGIDPAPGGVAADRLAGGADLLLVGHVAYPSLSGCENVYRH